MHDDASYVPSELLEDLVCPRSDRPVPCLAREHVDLSDDEEAAMRSSEAKRVLGDALRRAEESPLPSPDDAARRRLRRARKTSTPPTSADGREARTCEAISDALREEMRRDERVFLIGEDIGAYGGAFKVTHGFQQEFGEWRVIDAPLAETAIVGVAPVRRSSACGRSPRCSSRTSSPAPGISS